MSTQPVPSTAPPAGEARDVPRAPGPRSVSRAEAVTVPGGVPQRHREGDARNRRFGRVLRLVARVRRLDEGLMDEIGAAFLQPDVPAARLAEAMRLSSDHPEQVRMADVREALEHGIDAIDDAPPALRDFFETVEATPSWVDWDLLARGQRIYHRFGQNAGDVLLQLSLIGGYRFGGPTDLLAATGGLTGEGATARLAETQYWTTSLAVPDGLRPGGEAWRLTVHVRLMHALVNHSFLPRWDVERWGLPINQADQAATLGLFDAVVLLGVRALGVPVSREDSRAVMHLWKYVGWLMGVDERFLVDTEEERHRLNYHLLRAQADITEAGPKLTQALVEGQRRLHFPSFPRLRGWFARERLLSMLTTFLGRESMRDLGLPLRPGWAHAYLIPLNTWRYRTPWGRRRLDGWANRVSTEILDRYFGDRKRDVGELR